MALQTSSRAVERQAQLVTLCAVTALGLGGCAPEQRSTSIFQLCVGDEQGLARFKAQMASIANAEALPYRDASSEALWGKEPGRDSMRHFRTLENVVWVLINRSDGMGVGATNIGLSDFDVALGFTQGSDPAEARAFTTRVTHRLATSWDVKAVSVGLGAQPDAECMSSETTQAPSNKQLQRTVNDKVLASTAPRPAAELSR
jgi:hypothetical protein